MVPGFTAHRVQFLPGNTDVFLAPADGSAGDQAIVSGPNDERVSDWVLGRSKILYSLMTADNGFDIWHAEFSGDDWKLIAFLQTRSHEYGAKLSPDGRYIAYVCDEPAGTRSSSVPSLPAKGRGHFNQRRKQVRWRRDGRELFYTQEAAVIGVSLQTASCEQLGTSGMRFSS